MGSDSFMLVKKQTSNYLFIWQKINSRCFLCLWLVSSHIVFDQETYEKMRSDCFLFLSLPKDKVHTKKNYILYCSKLLSRKKGWVNLLFSTTFDVNKTSALLHAIDWFLFLLTNVYSEKKRKSKVVIFFLLDYVWESVLGNQYARASSWLTMGVNSTLLSTECLERQLAPILLTLLLSCREYGWFPCY
jgi:hypothetical protein